MTAYKRGDVILVPFRFSNQKAAKKRPAIVISCDAYSSVSFDTVIMAITSQTEKTLGVGECLIQDWHTSGLLKPSVIKPAISTIEQTLILKKLGKLSAIDVFSMENVLKKLLDIEDDRQSQDT
ncbi:MAG: type II toxin-antitoxin system PemK/MazF family toxin [Nitrospirae bacterium]|nr:type II toxin-antitoxin system PemK/MazF family toxin [Nitrospirota bacterium]